MHSRLRKILLLTLTSAVGISMSGCASIVSSGPARINVKSQPSGARLLVYDRYGTKVASQTTPSVLELRRGAGYFKAASYRIVVEMDGYASQTIDVQGTLNGWYLGNIVFGGLIGMLIVDPLTGSMYTLDPKNVDLVLGATAASVGPNESALVVVLHEQVPASLRGELQPVRVN